MNYTLRQVLPPASAESPIEIHLTEDEVQVGRRSKTVLAKFPQISRDHAVFLKSDSGNLFVRDLRSLNGVYVNNARIGSSLKSLSVGDVIGFGVTTDMTQEGFVCTVCCNNLDIRVKQEVIDISDDDDDNIPPTSATSIINSITHQPHIAPKSEDSSISSSASLFLNQTAAKTSTKLSKVAGTSNLENKNTASHKNNSFTSSMNSLLQNSNHKNINNLPFPSVALSNMTPTEAYDTNKSKTAAVCMSQNTGSKSNSLKKSVNLFQNSIEENQNASIPSKTAEINVSKSSKTVAVCSKPQNNISKCNTARKTLNSCVQNSIEENQNASIPSRTAEINVSKSSKTVAVCSKPQNNISKCNTARKTLNSCVQNSIEKKQNKSKSSDASLLSRTAIENCASQSSKTAGDNNLRFPSVPCQKTVVKKLSVESVIRVCVVPLVRCDSEFFQWPLDVKIPFQEGRKQSSYDSPRQISLLPNKKFSPKGPSGSKKGSNSNIEHQASNCKKLTNTQKRTYPFNSCSEMLDCQPSTSKKPCLVKENLRENFQDYSERNHSKINCKSDSDSDNELIYSQVEDIIYISDDDEYLDFKSSQDYVQIKTEPEDIEDNLDDIFNGNLENDECVTSDNEVGNFACLNQENENVETIESILAFVGSTEQKKDKQINDDSSKTAILAEENNDSDEENNLNINAKLKPYSDKFHVNQNIQNIPNESNVYNDEDNSYEHTSSSGMSKDRKKSTGKVLLIDAQPMQYRPRKMRGRDEGFVERRKSQPPSSVAKKQKLQSPKKQLPKQKIPFNLNSGLKNFKIPHKKRDNNVDHFSKETDYGQLSKEETSSKTASASVKKTPSVKTRPEKFTSRMGFLASDIEINPRRVSRSVTNAVTGTKAKDITKESNPNSSVKKNNPSSSVKNINASGTSHINANSSVTQTMSLPAIPSNKSVVNSQIVNNTATVFNPRDPRQNRAATNSSRFLRQDSNISKILPPTENISQLTRVTSNSKAPERPVLYNEQNNLLPVDLKSKLIKELLRLNTKWLEEQKKMKYPPEAVSAGAAELPLKFESYDSYFSSFYPMIMLEIWEQMYAESKEVYDSKKQYKKFYFSILSYSSKDDYIELKCEAVVNENVCFGPREGSITILELKENSKKCSPLFGYIYKHRIESLNLNALKLPHWKNLPQEWLSNAKHWTFYAQIRKKEMPFALESLMKGNGVCYIRNKLRLLDALCHVKHSPLLTDILHPRWQTFLVRYSATAATREYNSGQNELIIGVTNEITKSEKEPKIILLQGPPGTGKTHIIIGLIHKLFSTKMNKSSLKILVTAPSNAAIDEIGCRLIELSKKYQPDETIKFVRVGLVDQVHSKMRPYFIDQIAQDSNHNSSPPMSLQKQRELQNLLAEINRLEKEYYSNDRNERLKYLREKYKCLCETDSATPRDYYTEMTKKVTILKESNVILSTLSSCGLSMLLKAFNPSTKVQFSCCIIDEATQCTELEILQPLMLGVKKLIMVGDHKQLPATVLSKLACKYGFERSAFERFHSYFTTFCKKTPMFTLTEQFRMHSAICEFPSKFIYDHKLITNPSVDVKYEKFPFLPYMFLDIYVSQESDGSSSKKNGTEAEVIIKICTILMDNSVSASSIGIITPYQAQRTLYKNAYSSNPNYKDIEVNTVDGFQGREKDIIIVSSVRANQSGSIGFLACKQRLNVAITRAKKCLIVCGHADSLKNDSHWRELILDAEKRKVCFTVTSPEDIPVLLNFYTRKKK